MKRSKNVTEGINRIDQTEESLSSKTGYLKNTEEKRKKK